ncbi:nitroreductase family protein [Sagittula salina]|uniref:Nitroreductase family protein n=1 Tax=Sagittula salina TaxID=2820268 RepID=A0A940MNI2_9RHOB|nr:nitroreductase family protein [Sagittula salina]
MSEAAKSFGALLKARFSCRSFTGAPVDRALIDAALSDAQHVPSWCNSQPWEVHACGQGATRALAQAFFDHTQNSGHASDIPFPKAWEGPQQARRRTCGWQLYEAVGVQKGDREGSARQMRENFRLFGAQAFSLITTPKALGAYGVLDCGAFVTAFLLGLEARGLGAVAMASVAGVSPFMRDWFEVAEDRDVLCGVAIGHCDRDHPANKFRTERASLDEVVRWR